MKCSVNNCSNDTQTLQKGHGITFHNFPWFRNNWREVLGMDDESKADSLICSDHFRSEDITATKGGRPRIRVGALPIRCRRIQVCRICLTTDVKMYSIRDRELQQAYADVCGIIIQDGKLKDKLPETLCWECSARLLAGSRLRNRAIKSHQLLTQLLDTIPYITLRDINSINRSENDLEPNLSLHYNEPDDCDMYIREGILNKPDPENIIMKIEQIEGFEEDDFEEEYLEESNVVVEKNERDNDLINECELNDSDGEETEDNGNYERRVLKEEVNISDYDEYDDDGRNELDYSKGEENEDENEDDGNDERVLKGEATNSDKDEYDDDGRNYLNYSDENFEDNIKDTIVETRKTDLKVKSPKNITYDDEYGDDGRNDLNDSDENFEDNVSTVKTLNSNLQVKTPNKITDDDEYGDDGRNDLNDSDENFEDNVSTVKKRKSNLKVKIPNKITDDDVDDDNDDDDDDGRNYLNESDENIKEKVSTVKKRKSNLKLKAPQIKLAKNNQKKTSKVLDKSKPCQVKRRKPDGLDQSMFTVTSLSLEEQLEDAQLRRDAPRNQNARYRCDVCGLGFAKINRYELHLARHSELAGEYQCVVCATRQKTEAALRKHLASIHSRRYSCKQCPFVTQTRSMANNHQEWHVGAKFQCPHCPCLFTNRSSYLGHLRYKHRSDFICGLCGYAFLSKRGVAIHKNMLHRFIDEKMQLEGPYCGTCDVKFISAEAYDTHLKVASQHSDERALNQIRNDPQSVSDKAAQKRAGRRQKTQSSDATDKDGTRENTELVACEQCGKEFSGYRLYAQHFRYNHPEKTRTQFSGKNDTVMCEQCGRLFQSYTVLRDHMSTHTGKKLFQCSYCNRKYDEKSDLAEHIKKTNHSGEVTLECGKCEKIFIKKSTFLAHLKTHVRHDCYICGKEFIHPSNRKRHMWTHAALKPFKCDACDKTFANPSVQKSHFKHEHLKKPWPKRNKELPPEKRRMRVENRPPIED